MELDQIKQRFGIIGNDPELNRALDIARQVAGTDLSVLVTGESGVGKESIPQVIHQNSPRKHGTYIAVNCGAIPEGTIDSELFGHEKGSFTGAVETRKGYFEEADGGTLFLDEVAELPLSTQVRLLRVLQTGEFLKVGSAKVQKTDVRVVAATNVNLMHAISAGKFREDLYYRLNTVPISVPPLRNRKGDIHLLFRKFALDFADRYMIPAVRLAPEAQTMLENYRWPGNIRQLKSVAEQISVLEKDRLIQADVLARYIPLQEKENLPVLSSDAGADYMSDRDIIFRMIYQLRTELEDIKSQLAEGGVSARRPDTGRILLGVGPHFAGKGVEEVEVQQDEEEQRDGKESGYEERRSLSIHDVSADLIMKALEKHSGNRKAAASELGISERTLYRKIKDIRK